MPRSRSGHVAQQVQFTTPLWAKPAPLGYGGSADAVHFVAAPMLASACIATIGVVSADSARFRWPDATLLGLTLAAVALIGSVQFGFQARALLYSAADVEAWWGPQDATALQDQLRATQRDDFTEWRTKIDRAVTAYNLGVALIGLGLTLCLVPSESIAGGPAGFRWVAAASVGTAATAELLIFVIIPRLATAASVTARVWRRLRRKAP